MPGNTVSVGVQAKGVGKASSDLDKLRDKFDKFGKASAKGFAIGAGAGLALGAVNALGAGIGVATDFMRDSIQAASDMNESVSKSQVVFGRASTDVIRWGDSAAKSFGLSKQAAIETASSLGNLFTGLGQSQKSAAQMSEKLVELAGDLASFNNIDPTEALDKLRSGLSGESEPLRSVGVFLTEAKVKAKAMELGLADAHGELSEGAKVMARYQLILEETTTAQGDFARTADGLANSQRTAAAELKDYEAALGTKLIPAQKAAVQGQIAFIEGLGRLEGGLSDTGANLDGLVAQLPILGGAESMFAKQAAEHWALVRSETERAADGSQDAIEGMRGEFSSAGKKIEGSLGDVADASGNMKKQIKKDTKSAAESFRDLRDSMADDAQSMIDDYFDPIEERAALHETRLSLLAAEEERTKAKTVEGQRQASSAIVDALDDEGTHLVSLGKKGKLTNKDIDAFAKDAKRNYSNLSHDARGKLDAIIAKLRTLASFKSVAVNVRVGMNQGNMGNGGARASGGPVSRGKVYTVGEEGPETFVPNQSGTIIPNGGSGTPAMGGGGNTFNVTVNAGIGSGLTAGDARKLADTIGPAIYADMQRRGMLPRSGTGLTG